MNDIELLLLLQITRKLPKVQGAGFLANILKNIYTRKPRDPVQVSVGNYQMLLYPHECVDGGLLFYPQLYDHVEVKYLKNNLKEGDIFIDVGANIGFYSLLASGLVGSSGKVIAIEADKYNYEKLIHNIAVNKIKNIIAMNIGVADIRSELRLGLNTTGNRGGNSFLSKSKDWIEVECETLIDIIQKYNLNRINCIKIDIEGYEYKVMRKFLQESNTALHPEIMVVEHNPSWDKSAGGNVIQLLEQYGYTSLWSNKYNHIMKLSS